MNITNGNNGKRWAIKPIYNVGRGKKEIRLFKNFLFYFHSRSASIQIDRGEISSSKTLINLAFTSFSSKYAILSFNIKFSKIG